MTGPYISLPRYSDSDIFASRKLDDHLWELRFRCERVNQRITYTVEPERRVITLTTFRKQRSSERREVQRARSVLPRRKGKG